MFMTENTGKGPCAASSMAFVCSWPYVADGLQPIPKKQVQPATISFVLALCGSLTTIDEQLPLPVIKGDSLSIKISQEDYEKGIDDCKRLLHGRMVMSKGDKPYTAKDLFLKLSKLWKLSGNWKLVSFGRGFFEFEFSSLEDMRKAWAHGTMNLIKFSSKVVEDGGSCGVPTWLG